MILPIVEVTYTRPDRGSISGAASQVVQVLTEPPASSSSKADRESWNRDALCKISFV